VTLLADDRLAAVVDRMTAEGKLAGWLNLLPDEDYEMVERLLADRHALGWRRDPHTMASHLEADWRDWAYVQLLCSRFRAAAEGSSRRQIWMAPSRYGKSTIASRRGPAWLLDRDPATKLILTSYGNQLAVENASAVRDYLIEYQSDLHVRLRRDRRRADRFQTEEGGGILAAGVGSALTGFGAHGIVIDDPFKNWQEAHSEAHRDAVWNWYRSVVRTRLESDDAWVILVMTRWHEDDLAGRLMAEDEADDGEGWEVIRLPAIAEEVDAASVHPYLRVPDPLGREPGEVLEPDRFSLVSVLSKHRALGSYLTAGLEQQRPAPEEGGELKRAWWRWGTPPAKGDDSCSSWDMKLKDKTSGDYVVGQAWLRTGADFWCVDQLRGQFNFATTKAAIALLAVRRPDVSRHYIENTGNGPEVMEQLRAPQQGYALSADIQGTLGATDVEARAVERIMRRGMPGLLAVNPKGDKVARVRAHAGIIESGNVHLPEYAPWAPGLVDEAAAFPNGAHDDQVDALSQALSKLHHGDATATGPPRGGPMTRPRPGRQNPRDEAAAAAALERARSMDPDAPKVNGGATVVGPGRRRRGR
jgi:phage terminase large subunit-like protein